MTCKKLINKTLIISFLKIKKNNLSIKHVFFSTICWEAFFLSVYKLRKKVSFRFLQNCGSKYLKGTSAPLKNTIHIYFFDLDFILFYNNCTILPIFIYNLIDIISLSLNYLWNIVGGENSVACFHQPNINLCDHPSGDLFPNSNIL